MAIRIQPRCIFCHEPGASPEHLWSRWMRSYFPRTAHDSRVEATMRPNPRLRTPQFFPGTKRHGHNTTMTVKSVCKRCNNGWMSSEIEGSAIPPLKKLIVSEATVLTAQDQLALTNWFVLKSMVLEHGVSTEGCVNSREQCGLFYRTRSLSGALQVWLFRCGETRWRSTLTRHCSQLWSDEAPHLKGTYPNTHTVVMGVGDLLAFVFQSSAVNIDFGFDGRAARCIYPVGDVVVWPPTAAISWKGAADLADTLGRCIRASTIHEAHS